MRLKAILARTLFDTTAFYEVFNPINPIYQRGIEVLRDGTYKKSGIEPPVIHAQGTTPLGPPPKEDPVNF